MAESSSSQPNKDGNYFDGKAAFDWENYLIARPDYNLSSFYDELYSYHASHSNRWDTAFDIGCGPGQVADKLASKFAAVHGSDPNPFIINVAKYWYKDTKSVDFEVAAAEDLLQKTPEHEGTADLVTVAECIPIMNTEASMATFGKLLRPGGTLAIWFYGGPFFVSPDADEGLVKEVQALQRKLVSRSLDQFRPMKGTSWEQGTVKLWCWLDNIALPAEEWTEVKRIKWNSDWPLSFEDKEELDFDVEAQYTNNIGTEETIEKRTDLTIWRKEKVDIQWVRGQIDAQMPRPKDYVTDEVKQLYGELEKKMEGKTWNVTWPVILILAVKK